MQRRRLLSAFLSSFALAACAGSGPLFSPITDRSDGRAIVYVYRPSSLALGILTALIDVEGRQVAILENGEYVALRLSPGSYWLQQRWKAGRFGDKRLEGRPVAVQVVLGAGEERFLRLSSINATRTAGVEVTHRAEWNLQLVQASVALVEIARCRLGRLESA